MRIWGLLLLALVGLPRVAEACSCSGYPSEEEAFAQADVVVIARTVRVEHPWTERWMGFSGLPDEFWLMSAGMNRWSVETEVAVEEVLLGSLPETVWIDSKIGVCCDCSRGEWTTAGRRHLLYLDRTSTGAFRIPQRCRRAFDAVPDSWSPPASRLETRLRLRGPLPDDLPSALWMALMLGLLFGPAAWAARRGGAPQTVVHRALFCALTPLLGVALWAVLLEHGPAPPPAFRSSVPVFGWGYWRVLFWGKELLLASGVGLGALAFWRPARGASARLAMVAATLLTGAHLLDAQNALSLSWVFAPHWNSATHDALREATSLHDVRVRCVHALGLALVLGSSVAFVAERRRVGGVRFPTLAQVGLLALLLLSGLAVRSWDRQLATPEAGGHDLLGAPRGGDVVPGATSSFPVIYRPVAVIEVGVPRIEGNALKFPPWPRE